MVKTLKLLIKDFFIMVILIVLGIGLVAFGAYYFFNELPVDETVSWKTFKYSEYGKDLFEIKYPADWGYDFMGTTQTNSNWVLSFLKDDHTQPEIELPGDNWGKARYVISIHIKNNPEFYSASEYVEKAIEEGFLGGSFIETTIGGARAIRYSVDAAPSSGPCTQISTAYGGFIYTFSYCATAHPETHEKFIGVFNQMFSTFTFLEKNARALNLTTLKNMEYQLFACPTSSDNYLDDFFYRYNKEACRVKLA